jgi:hypothetical protein
MPIPLGVQAAAAQPRHADIRHRQGADRVTQASGKPGSGGKMLRQRTTRRRCETSNPDDRQRQPRRALAARIASDDIISPVSRTGNYALQDR